MDSIEAKNAFHRVSDTIPLFFFFLPRSSSFSSIPFLFSILLSFLSFLTQRFRVSDLLLISIYFILFCYYYCCVVIDERFLLLRFSVRLFTIIDIDWFL